MTRPFHVPLRRPVARLLPALALALAAFLALGAVRASATITSTRITTPAADTFEIEEYGAPPGSIPVAGTTDSTDPSHDAVDIYCSANGLDRPVAEGVPLAADGSFRTAIPTGSVYRICRLRALPAGAGFPADPSPFTGPVVARGWNHSQKVLSGRNEGVTSDFSISAQQLSAADQFASAGSCGLGGSYLLNAALEETTITFSCNDWFWYVANEAEEATSRSELQVDGRNAYLPDNATRINGEASGLPEVTYSYRQDPANGNLYVTETEPLVECPNQEFPPNPGSCPSFVPTGVVDTRTIEQTDDGHLVTIADSFASSDGEAHALDMLNQQDVAFYRFRTTPSGPLGFRFPGQADYSTHATGDVVDLAEETPGTIYIRRQGGAAETGRGAIVFDRPASSATFNSVGELESTFYLHQTATVPAQGATTFRYAFAQAYEQGEVEALVAQARAAFAGTAAPPAEPPATTPAPPVKSAGSAQPGSSGHPSHVPGSRLALGKVLLDRAHGTARLSLTLPGPGLLMLSGAGIQTVRRHVGGPGPLSLTVRPTPAFASTLRRRGHAAVSVKIAFTPAGGTAMTQSRVLRLIERRGA